MKKLFILLFILLIPIIVSSEKAEEIKLTGFVNDYADVLSIEQEALLSSSLTSLYTNNIAQVSIVTINSLEGRDIESFSYEVAEGKLGEEEENNGLLILIAINDKKYRFEVGRGLEPFLNDAKVGRIGRDYLVPAFQKGDYYQGLDNAVNEVSLILTGNEPVKQEVVSHNEESNYSYAYIIAFIYLIFMIMSIARRKREGDKYFIAAGIASTLMRGGRGGFGGGLGGGFGGGSGGFSGGGASGGW